MAMSVVDALSIIEIHVNKCGPLAGCGQLAQIFFDRLNKVAPIIETGQAIGARQSDKRLFGIDLLNGNADTFRHTSQKCTLIGGPPPAIRA